MSVQPIDLQVLLAKTADVGKIQHIEQQNPQIQQSYLNLQAQIEEKREEEQVQNTKESVEKKIHQESKGGGREESPKGKNKKGKGEKSSEEESQLKDPIRGKIIDIKL